jgi:hypothetical protein
MQMEDHKCDFQIRVRANGLDQQAVEQSLDEIGVIYLMAPFRAKQIRKGHAHADILAESKQRILAPPLPGDASWQRQNNSARK